MHFKETVTMDMAESFRHADVSKTDFFELVTSPELTDAQFKQQMRSVNVFLESAGGGNPLISGEPRTLTPAPNPSMPPSANPPLQSFDSIWNTDRERDRLETAILEDLNKFYWSQEQDQELDASPETDVAVKTEGDNTDGQIYTLTVLDGETAAVPWERAKQQHHHPPALPSPGTAADPADLQHSSLDLDSILNIMPTQMNGFSDNFLPNPLIKEEPFNFEDSGFADHKDVLDNNNDWKLADQNGGGESLLRSALQGRGTRYVPRSSPPAPQPTTPQAQDRLVMTLDGESGVNIVLFENPTSILPEHENPPSAQSVDDILLSQLDTAYPDDYDKFNRIASEVAESVQQFCGEEVNGRAVYSIQQLSGSGLVTMLPNQEPQHLQLVTSATVSSTKSVTKKYKRSQSKSQNLTTSNAGAHAATSTSNGIRKERSLHYCSICSKGFKDKYSVNVHIRTHTGEKPFACSLCGKSFRQKAHLAKHYQTHIAQKNAAAAGTVKTGKQR